MSRARAVGAMDRTHPGAPGGTGGRTTSAVLLLALVLCGSAPTLAATGGQAREASYVREGAWLVHRVDGSVPLEGARVRVQTDLGSVRVAGGAPGTTGVTYRIQVRAAGADADEGAARRLLDRLAVSASRSGKEMLFLGELRGDDVAPPAGLEADFELTIPTVASGLEVATGQGDVSVAGLGGPVTLRSGAGVIEVRDVSGLVRAETGGGRIEATGLGAGAQLVSGAGGVRVGNARGDVTVRTSGGEIVVGRVAGRVRGESGGGSVRVDEAGGEVIAETAGGNINIGRAGGRVTAVTTGGSIRVGSAAAARCETSAGSIDLKVVDGPIRAVTSAGSIRADLEPSAAARWSGDSSLETWQGDVVLSLPESIRITLRAMVDNPVGRAIRSDFPLTIVRDIEAAGRPMEIAEGAVGSGGPILKLRTLGGNIVILKSSEAGR